jgi:hypothetical protein
MPRRDDDRYQFVAGRCSAGEHFASQIHRIVSNRLSMPRWFSIRPIGHQRTRFCGLTKFLTNPSLQTCCKCECTFLQLSVSKLTDILLKCGQWHHLWRWFKSLALSAPVVRNAIGDGTYVFKDSLFSEGKGATCCDGNSKSWPRRQTRKWTSGVLRVVFAT